MSEEISRLEKGLRIERRAEEWLLERLGGCVIARNYRIRGGELDLVIEVPRDDGVPELIFVEVRGRLPGNWQSGLESVGAPKRRRLSRAVRHFLAAYRGKAMDVRFDVIDWDGKRFVHYRNVWI